MKIFFILTFFVIFSCAKNDLPPKENSSCEEFPPKLDIDLKRYFNGTWYAMYTKEENPSSVCQTLKMTIKPDDTLDEEIYGYSVSGRRKKERFILIHCNGSENDTKGKYSLLCELVEDSKGKIKNQTVTYEGVVLETDYDNFSIIYRCLSHGTQEFGTFHVLTRKKEDNSTYDAVQKILETYDTDLDEFNSRENFKCKQHPKE